MNIEFFFHTTRDLLLKFPRHLSGVIGKTRKAIIEVSTIMLQDFLVSRAQSTLIPKHRLVVCVRELFQDTDGVVLVANVIDFFTTSH